MGADHSVCDYWADFDVGEGKGMKATDLIEAIQTASKAFQLKHGKPMEIFGLTFNEDEYDGDMQIEAVGEVIYDDDKFGCGQRRGLLPHEKIRIRFEIEDGKIDDRSVSFEDDE